MSQPPRPDANVAHRVEELLREQLEERGVHVSKLSPADIAEGMTCQISPDNSMVYFWRGTPLLSLVPEPRKDGAVLWRMFTRDDVDGPGTPPQPADLAQEDD